MLAAAFQDTPSKYSTVFKDAVPLCPPRAYSVRTLLGRLVGKEVGNAVGRRVGRAVGRFVGNEVGNAVGKKVGRAVGRLVGKEVGNAVGKMVGRAVGRGVGDSERVFIFSSSWAKVLKFPVKCKNTITKQAGYTNITHTC
jgi:hypothetical protein